jgi:hypothetical protein
VDDAPVRGAERPRRPVTAGRVAVVLGALGLAIVLWGGYGRHWRWTGFQRNATLWDWLHVLVLPLAFVVAPLWVRHRTRMDPTRHVLLTLAAAGFAILVVLGYALDLGWTGFPGNRLWDWLELLVLPLAVAFLPVWSDLWRGLRPHHVAVAACTVAALVVTAVGGYEYDWRWTGFEGNTLFDWLQLFVAPLLLPIVLVPLVGAWLVADIAERE